MPLGRQFNEWLREQGKEPVNPAVEVMLDEIGAEIAGDEWLKATIAAGVAKAMAEILRQEYKPHEGRWWLWSLGEPVRPLTGEEVWEKRLGPIP